MERIRTAVCDDEPDARDGLIDLLGEDPEIELVAQARDGAEAAEVVTASIPDLLFLDIQMPELDGFVALDAMVRELGIDRMPVVVFVSAYDAYALRAFEVHALDYLLKPFSDVRFAETLGIAKDRVRQRRAGVIARQLASLFRGERPRDIEVAMGADAVSPATQSASAAGTRYLERIQVRVGQRVYFVPVADIDWIEADDYYARLHVEGRSYLVREPLHQLASTLDPSRFVRVHRSAIVNIPRVKLMQPYLGGAHVITLGDGTTIPLSRSRREAFERALGSRL